MALYKAQTAPSYTSLDALAGELERILKALDIPTNKALPYLIGDGKSLPDDSYELLEILATNLEQSEGAAKLFMLITEVLWY